MPERNRQDEVVVRWTLGYDRQEPRSVTPAGVAERLHLHDDVIDLLALFIVASQKEEASRR